MSIQSGSKTDKPVGSAKERRGLEQLLDWPLLITGLGTEPGVVEAQSRIPGGRELDPASAKPHLTPKSQAKPLLISVGLVGRDNGNLGPWAPKEDLQRTEAAGGQGYVHRDHLGGHGPGTLPCLVRTRSSQAASPQPPARSWKSMWQAPGGPLACTLAFQNWGGAAIPLGPPKASATTAVALQGGRDLCQHLGWGS